MKTNILLTSIVACLVLASCHQKPTEPSTHQPTDLENMNLSGDVDKVTIEYWEGTTESGEPKKAEQPSETISYIFNKDGQIEKETGMAVTAPGDTSHYVKNYAYTNGLLSEINEYDEKGTLKQRTAVTHTANTVEHKIFEADELLFTWVYHYDKYYRLDSLVITQHDEPITTNTYTYEYIDKNNSYYFSLNGKRGGALYRNNQGLMTSTIEYDSNRTREFTYTAFDTHNNYTQRINTIKVFNTQEIVFETRDIIYRK